MIEDQSTISTEGGGIAVPLSRFPEAFRARLSEALTEHAGLWYNATWDAFEAGGLVYLRVALAVGDQHLALYLHQDGDVLQFEAPLVHDFPMEASGFVLSELCGRNTLMSFRVDLDPYPILYAWGRLEFATFLRQHSELMPYLSEKVNDAKKALDGFAVRFYPSL